MTANEFENGIKKLVSEYEKKIEENNVDSTEAWVVMTTYKDVVGDLKKLLDGL